MTDAPFTPGAFAGPGLTGEHLAAIEMDSRARRMDAWAGQIAAGLASSFSAWCVEDDPDDPREAVERIDTVGAENMAAVAWVCAAALERRREAALTDFDKEE